MHDGLIKPLAPTGGAAVPRELAHGELRATAITRADLRDDVAGINASIDLIRRTRGGPWPEGPTDEVVGFDDLVWHEVEFRDGGSFTYVLRDAGGSYLGCLYLYPVGRRTALTERTAPFDVDVSWWVTPEAHARGFYGTVGEALERWLGDELPFAAPLYSNRDLAPPD